MARKNRSCRRIAAHQRRQDQKVRTAPRHRGQTRRGSYFDGFRSRCATRKLTMDVEKGTRQLKGLIEKLERNNRTLRSHPTIEKIERGELSQGQFRNWATNFLFDKRDPT